jgi:HMG (high mobility group) box
MNLLHDFDNYYIPKEYIPIIVNKNLFKNSEKAVRTYKNINIPLYVLDDFELSIKKSPNSFIIFRKEMFNKVKLKHANCSSREISRIIGNMWNKMTFERKFPYLQKANELKKNYDELYPRQKYKTVISNIKKREYIKKKEINNNLQYLNIKKLINNELFKGLFNNN